MSHKPLLGVRKHMISIPRHLHPLSRLAWRTTAKTVEMGVRFFISKEHHLVRNYAARELTRVGSPLTPEFIANALDMPVERVNVILDEWVRRRVLLKNEQGAVTCVYPVRVDIPQCSSLHHVIFSNDEQMQTA
jgi:hypothetical protein